MLKIRSLAALAALSLLAPAAASSEPVLLVDAGTTRRVEVSTPFFLEARTDEDPGSLTFAWTGPAGCSVAAPSSRITTAACDTLGPVTFQIEASGAPGSGSDTVTMVVVESFDRTHVFSGTTLAGLPDEFTGSGELDGATASHPFTVPSGARTIEATLDWDPPAADIDLVLVYPDGGAAGARTLNQRPRRLTIDEPPAGGWRAEAQPRAAAPTTWTLTVRVQGATGDVSIPSIHVPPVSWQPGQPVTLTATTDGGSGAHTISWETTTGSVAFDDGIGDSITFTPVSDTAVTAKVTDDAGFEIATTVFVRERGTVPDDPFTVVAVIDFGFSPYHYDFVGHQHPWNLDDDPTNDFDFRTDPSLYIDGHPGAVPIEVTIPSRPDAVVTGLRETDAGAWGGFGSTTDINDVNLAWFPGTKIVGALRFSGEFFAGNSSHGTRSAASAAGNINGTCPECVFVLVHNPSPAALVWVASQPWIDAVNNSYVYCTASCALASGIHLEGPTGAMRAATERGQTMMFSSGNGLANMYDMPQFTYTAAEHGSDWTITVGANSPSTDQNYLGSGKPVDISSVGASYPSSGGNTAAGTGTHSGTSNAGPVVVGLFAKVLHEARALLGDTTEGSSGGVVASGTPVACGSAVISCALGDGTLTRAEWWDLVFHNVLPSEQRVVIGNQLPTTEHAYYYQGHGAVIGRLRGDAVWRGEWERMIANARGEVAAFERPDGEREWFTIDSKCRQKLWGNWNGGYYTGVEPDLDPVSHPLASAFDAWCSPLPGEPSD